MKINKIRPKFIFLTKIEKKKWLTLCFCLFFTVSSSLEPFGSRFILKFQILSCTNNKKNVKPGDSEADRSISKLHKSQKSGPNSSKLPSNDLSIICLFLHAKN